MSNWSDTDISVVAFAAPYPPDYGGVIDVYYKIRALAELGVRVHLHAFVYGTHQPSPALQQLCASVKYYPRALGVKYLQGIPYIISSRLDKNLIKNVLDQNNATLLEGLHTAFLLPHLRSAGIRHALRLHNVEWKYYRMLAEGERAFVRKKYFLEESVRLKSYERILSKSPIITLSANDTEYTARQFPASPLLEIMPFHPFNGVEVLNGAGEYAIFHGNLSVNENELAAEWLISKVFSKLSYPLVIAGKQPSERLKQMAKAYPHIDVMADPDEVSMQRLLQNAQVHVLPNEQPTGMKLKWVHALHTARFIIAHPDMVGKATGTAGIYACSDASEYQLLLRSLATRPFDQQICMERIAALGTQWVNHRNAVQMLQWMQKNYV